MARRPFGDWRERAGLDIHQAALHTGLSVGYLRDLEAGRKPCLQRAAYVMAREYGITIDDLFRPVTTAAAAEDAKGERSGMRTAPLPTEKRPRKNR